MEHLSTPKLPVNIPYIPGWASHFLSCLYSIHKYPYAPIISEDCPYVTGGYWGYNPFTKWDAPPSRASLLCLYAH